jgi:hypothetical protein
MGMQRTALGLRPIPESRLPRQRLLRKSIGKLTDAKLEGCVARLAMNSRPPALSDVFPHAATSRAHRRGCPATTGLPWVARLRLSNAHVRRCRIRFALRGTFTTRESLVYAVWCARTRVHQPVAACPPNVLAAVFVLTGRVFVCGGGWVGACACVCSAAILLTGCSCQWRPRTRLW